MTRRISIVADAVSPGAVELLASALRDQSQPGKKNWFWQKRQPSELLKYDIDVLVLLPDGVSRDEELAAARRIGHCADSKDAAPFFKRFDLHSVTKEGASIYCLQDILSLVDGDWILFVPDMTYFWQEFLYAVIVGHWKKGFDVLIPEFRVRYPPIVAEGQRAAYGRDGREVHSRLGKDSCGPLGFLLDNDCDEEVWEDENRFPDPVYCASYSRSFLRERGGLTRLDHAHLMLTAFSVGIMPEHVIHLALPWNESLLRCKNSAKNQVQGKRPPFVKMSRPWFG